MTAAHALGVTAAVAAAAAWLALVRYVSRHPRALDAAPANCRWCSLRYAAGVRNLTTLPSDCRCEEPCIDLACNARPAKEVPGA